MLLKILKIVLFVFLDIAVFIFCGVFMMGYDDFYDESQGEYFSFSSMKIEYKIVWGFYNFWMILNGLLLLYVLFIIFRKIKVSYGHR
ncbi:hypothetical protein C8C83_0047 [Flavobacterium sp. 90]|nr:hypothetical protein C8C82_0336 [Flavobacterium sp. 81]TCK52258.1 hypothetical protein C8C83_0047 [Flavobacterium sp. 90]